MSDASYTMAGIMESARHADKQIAALVAELEQAKKERDEARRGREQYGRMATDYRAERDRLAEAARRYRVVHPCDKAPCPVDDRLADALASMEGDTDG